MSHTIGSSTANYTWDVNRATPEILQDGTNTFVYGIGRISATDGSGNQRYYTSDGLGSTTELTDGSSSPTKTDGYTYDVFGATATHSPNSSSGQPFQFAGEQTDADSGLQYLRSRYYDPGTGRFLARDPYLGMVNAPGTQNRYVYGLDNPATLTDPLGLCSQSCESVDSPTSRASIGPTQFDKFLQVLHDYLACVQLGVVIACGVQGTFHTYPPVVNFSGVNPIIIVAVMALNIANPLTTALIINSFAAVLAANSNGHPDSGELASGELSAGSSLAEPGIRAYWRKFAQAHNGWGSAEGDVLEGSAEAGTGLSRLVGAGLYLLGATACAQEVGLFGLL